MDASIVLVHLGPKPFPDYGYDCIEQARLFNPGARFFLIVSDECTAIDTERLESSRCTLIRSHEIKRTVRHRFYLSTNLLKRKGLGGFWLFATERFFLIEELMRMKGLENVVHLENDVLLYLSLDEILDKIDRLYTSLAIVRDNDKRCLASFLFINNIEAITRFNTYISFNIMSRSKNDMQLLSEYSRSKYGIQLPLAPPWYDEIVGLVNSKGDRPRQPRAYSNNFESLGVVFDAACLGQYVGGIDKIHSKDDTRGFVNETSYLNPSKGSIIWRYDELGRRKPYFCVDGKEVAIANLHIHSKELEKYRSDRI